jgi:hypothetical protein
LKWVRSAAAHRGRAVVSATRSVGRAGSGLVGRTSGVVGMLPSDRSRHPCWPVGSTRIVGGVARGSSSRQEPGGRGIGVRTEEPSPLRSWIRAIPVIESGTSDARPEEQGHLSWRVRLQILATGRRSRAETRSEGRRGASQGRASRAEGCANRARRLKPVPGQTASPNVALFSHLLASLRPCGSA